MNKMCEDKGCGCGGGGCAKQTDKEKQLGLPEDMHIVDKPKLKRFLVFSGRIEHESDGHKTGGWLDYKACADTYDEAVKLCSDMIAKESLEFGWCHVYDCEELEVVFKL